MTIICGFVSGTAVEIADTSLIKTFFMENHEDSFFLQMNVIHF